MQRAIDRIVIHCSATASGQWLGGKPPPGSNRRPAWATIDRWHRDRAFTGIGYHYLIDLDGKVLKGRPEGQIGAHVAGHNSRSLGICLIGGIERDARYTHAQWRALAELVGDIAARYRLPLEAAAICGHRDLSPDLNRDGKVTSNEWLKTCPGFNVATWLERGLVPESMHLIDSDDGGPA